MSEGLFFNIYPMISLPPAFPILVGVIPSSTGMFNDSVSQLMVGNYYVAYSNNPLIGLDIATSPLLFLEVALFWCTKTFVTRVRDGIAGARDRGDHFAMCYVAQSCAQMLGDLQAELQSPPVVGGGGRHKEQEQVEERYTINVWTSLLSSILLGSAMYDSLLMDQTRGIIVSTGGGIAQAFATAIFGDFLASEAPGQEAQFENGQGIAADLERSITNHIRDGDTRLVGDNILRAVVVGTALSPQTFVKIRWKYVGLLGTQIALTSFFLAAVVIVTTASGTQALKESSLKTMTALSDATRRHLVEKRDPAQPLNERAGLLKVRLEDDGPAEGLRLTMLRRQSRQSLLAPIDIQAAADTTKQNGRDTDLAPGYDQM